MSELPDPKNCVEFVNKDGRRFAWSESNVCYEEVPPYGGSFTVLRKRLKDREMEIELVENLARGVGWSEAANCPPWSFLELKIHGLEAGIRCGMEDLEKVVKERDGLQLKLRQTIENFMRIVETDLCEEHKNEFTLRMGPRDFTAWRLEQGCVACRIKERDEALEKRNMARQHLNDELAR